MEEGNRSDYNGILLKMGRSVDFLNINSSKKMTMNSKKSINSGTVHYGKLLNDWKQFNKNDVYIIFSCS